MTTRSNRNLGLAAGGAVAVAVAVWWARHPAQKSAAPAPSLSGAALSSSAESEPAPPAAHLPFEFDCQAFVPTQGACSPANPALSGLLDFANQYRVSGQSCSGWLSGANAKTARTLLGAAASLEPRKLSALEKAALQNAALKLLGCARSSQEAPETAALVKQTSALVKRFTLSAAEQDALPASAELLRPWLADPAQWSHGVEQDFAHVRSEGFARAHLPLSHEHTVADVVRLVLVDESGKPYFPDTVQRVVLRRLESDKVRVCIAELVPSCAGGLQPLPPVRQPLSMRGQGSPPCQACHVNQHMPSAPFGPPSGFAPNDAVVALINARLPALLADSSAPASH